jgi:hypothetical protein
MKEVRPYQLRSPSVVQAVRWFGDHPQDLAEKIVNWVNAGDGEIAGYSPTTEGPEAADGRKWGLLTLHHDDEVIRVHPGDYITRNEYGKFFVIDPQLFESVYHELSDHE